MQKTLNEEERTCLKPLRKNKGGCLLGLIKVAAMFVLIKIAAAAYGLCLRIARGGGAA